MTWSAEKRTRRILRGSAELLSAIGIFVIRVFSRGFQVCKKINTFLWVCQVFVLFFFVLWHLKHIVSASRFAVAGMLKLFAAHIVPQDICRATLSAFGPFGELLEALTIMVNKLL